MRERVLDRLKKAPVKFRFFSFHLDQHLFAASGGDIADHARKLVKDIADGLHARSHHFFLQFARQQIELLQRTGQVGIGLARGKLRDLISRQHQFPDKIHQPVQQADVDANGFGHGVLGAGVILRGFRRLSFFWFCGWWGGGLGSDGRRLFLLPLGQQQAGWIVLCSLSECWLSVLSGAHWVSAPG